MCGSFPDSALACIAGVADLQHLIARARPDVTEYCVEAGVTVSQLRDLVCMDLAAVPETRHCKASALVLGSLLRAWPCETP